MYQYRTGLPSAFALALLLPLGFVRADENKGGEAASLFSATTYIDHVRYLASDELTGRGPDSEGQARAAQYIYEHFKTAGLEPAGIDGTYFQSFDIKMRKKLDPSVGHFTVAGADREWVIKQDWVPLPFSQPTDFDAPVAFVGYGIEAPEHKYDDYDGFDGRGRVFLMFRYEPRAENEEAEFGGKTPSKFASFTEKCKVAEKHGAKAILLVNPPLRDPDKDTLYEFDARAARSSNELPMIHISRELAESLLKKGGLAPLKELQEKLDKDHKSQSAVLKDVTVRVNQGLRFVQSKNVLGMLKGDGTTTDVIVVGAHYDHLGNVPAGRMGGGGGGSENQIHNGADDNASGTAGVIELARAFGAGPRPHRNILFMTFAGEEDGLLGSRYFCEHPTVELNRVKAMVNFDMIGRSSGGATEFDGTFTARELPDIVERANEKVGLKFSVLKGKNQYWAQSDHYSFWKKNIPVVFPFTGIHRQYHQPTDDWERIDGVGAAKILMVSYNVINDLAAMSEGPTFIEDKPAEKPTESVPAQQPAYNMKVRLGVMPDYSAEKAGMLIDTVIEGGVAAKSGMKNGDRIIRISNEEVTDMQKYMELMSKFKPGDEAEFAIDRKGEALTIKVKFDVAPASQPQSQPAKE